MALYMFREVRLTVINMQQDGGLLYISQKNKDDKHKGENKEEPLRLQRALKKSPRYEDFSIINKKADCT